MLPVEQPKKFPTIAEMQGKALALLLEQTDLVIVGYAQWTEVLGLNPAEDRRARTAVLKAGRVLLHEHNRRLVNVRTEGYQIVKPSDHVGVSQGEQRRSRRWLRRALATVTHVALDKLTPQEVARVMIEQSRTALAYGMLVKISRVK